MVLIVGHDLFPLETLHIQHVHIVHAILSISPTKDVNILANFGGRVGSSGHWHRVAALRPIPGVGRRVVAHELVIPATEVVLKQWTSVTQVRTLTCVG